MATTDEILQQLIDARQSTYKPKTMDQIRAQAEGEYQSLYDQRRRSAQQTQQAKDLALSQQLAGIGRSYDKAREQSLRDYRMRYSQADRQMLSRGMQRSSYGAQVLANIGLEGQRAQDDIWEQQVGAEGNIEAQRTQLAQQLADQLAGYDADQAADVLARIRQLEDQEYDRGLQSANIQSSLSAQIYQFLYQAERDKIEDDRWQKQWDEQHKSYSGAYTTPKKKEEKEDSAETKQDPFSFLMEGLGGDSTAGTTKPAGTTKFYDTLISSGRKDTVPKTTPQTKASTTSSGYNRNLHVLMQNLNDRFSTR